MDEKIDVVAKMIDGSLQISIKNCDSDIPVIINGKHKITISKDNSSFSKIETVKNASYSNDILNGRRRVVNFSDKPRVGIRFSDKPRRGKVNK